MTIYATLIDLQTRFTLAELVQLTDDELTGAIDQTRIDQALASASAEVEGYVAATYAFAADAPIPLLLIDITCDIARARLYRTETPDNVTSRYNQAVRKLESIRSGKLKLDGGVEAIAPRPGKVLTQSGVRRMSRQQMEGF